MSMSIQTKSVPRCPVCDSSGVLYLHSLKDVLYAVPGAWSMRRCTVRSCRTLWLDPVAIESELYKLYSKYSTHVGPGLLSEHEIKKSRIGFLKKFLNNMRSSALSISRGYPNTIPKYQQFLYSALSRLIPAWRDAQLANIFYVPYVKNGRLLDVGCGNGSSMLLMRAQGWNVEGFDFDPSAIHKALEQNLNVSVGDIYSKKFDDEVFDVIMMNHVIEHLPDPKKVLQECLRILKKGGVLVAFTPNSKSFGFGLFKNNWRGLEVPRHLQVFTSDSLELIGKSVGFSDVKSLATIQGSTYIINASREISKHGSCDTHIHGNLYKILTICLWHTLGWVYLFFPKKSEVSVLYCKK